MVGHKTLHDMFDNKFLNKIKLIVFLFIFIIK